MIETLGSLFESVSEVFEFIESIVSRIAGVFSDVDFTVLYSCMPSDIQGVITAVLVVLLFLALIGLIKKVILFFG